MTSRIMGAPQSPDLDDLEERLLAPASDKGTRDDGLRNGLICAVIFAGCLWAAHPVAEMGFIDDWSYVKTAQVFAQTGHFVYNGWSAPILGWQVLWGALFIKLFGFSFTAVRLSTVVVAMATVVLFHAVLVRFGVSARNAVVGTLTLGLSPLFLPMAASYMTEVPGLFAVVLCLYLCQRAVAARSDGAAIAWLCAAAVSNVVGGTARQIAWLGALVMVPSAGWLLRKRRGVLPVTALLWVGSVASVLACVRWFERQPYSIPEAIFRGPTFNRGPAFDVVVAFHVFFGLLGAVLCLLLIVSPLLIAWLTELRRLNRASLFRIASITLGYGLFQYAVKWTMPWLYHVIRFEFAYGRTGEMAARESVPFSLPLWVREIFSVVIVVAGLVFVERVASRCRLLRRNGRSPAASWRQMVWLLGPFALGYFVMLLPRAYHGVLFDRYLLLVMPVAIICLIKLYQEWVAVRLPMISGVMVAVLALLAVAGTHDWFAWNRARLAAIDEVRAVGVRRTEIQGGFEYDGWTQIEAAGYINDPHLRVPVGAYRANVEVPRVAEDCQLDFASYTPAIRPQFTIAFGEKWCLRPSRFPAVSYRSWLPPYGRKVIVQEIRGR